MSSPIERILGNARLVLPDRVVDRGVLVLRGETILEIGEGPAPAGALDWDGDLLLPGLVELHTDNLERHLMPRPGVAWPSFAALCAHDSQIATSGITTVFDAVAIGDRDGREERLDYLDDAMTAITSQAGGDTLRADHFIHLRCEVPRPDVCELFERYAGYDRVRFVSLMDHTPGDRQFPDIERLKEYSLLHYGETEETFAARVAEEQAMQARYATRNKAAIAAAARARGFVLASHDDARPAHIEEAASLGVSVSEFPTTVEAARSARQATMGTIMGGPNVMRGGSASGNVSAGDLARLDLLDALSSDYVPLSLIHAPFRIAADLGWPLERAVALVTSNPARMGGLQDRGAIAPGLRADLVRVQMGEAGPLVRETWRAGARVA